MSRQTPARYVAYWSAPGCLADSSSGPVICYTRREFVQWIDAEMAIYGLSGRARRGVNLAWIWRLIQRLGSSSSVHFSIQDTAPGSLYSLEFRGLTEAEFLRMESELDAA